ncbi:hypothetical protein D1007_21537 [Hordeum vulgare]|nr:hypothetical protein D1007_21537 [Hordeum vulgare]
MPPSVRTVSIPFADLKIAGAGQDLSGKIEEGLGPNGLGIISISDVPDFPALRRTLLRLAPSCSLHEQLFQRGHGVLPATSASKVALVQQAARADWNCGDDVMFV